VTSLSEALDEIRPLLRSPGLVRAIGRGFADGTQTATLRPVSLKAGTRLQLVVDDGVRPTTSYPSPDDLDRLLEGDFKSWIVETDQGRFACSAPRRARSCTAPRNTRRPRRSPTTASRNTCSTRATRSSR
jgi:hypothetical protein